LHFLILIGVVCFSCKNSPIDRSKNEVNEAIVDSPSTQKLNKEDSGSLCNSVKNEKKNDK